MCLTVTESRRFQTGRKVSGLQKLKGPVIGMLLGQPMEIFTDEVDANRFCSAPALFFFLRKDEERNSLTHTATFRKLLISSMLLN